MEKNASPNVLRIGDFVTFKAAQFGGSFCAEGILLQDLCVVDNLTVFDDSLFCVHLQRQYSAAKELEEFIKKDKIDIRNISDANTAKYYQALKRGADNESKLNDTYLRKGMGKQINFGDIIQLFHVKSGKYVKIISDQLAKDERENIRIVLDTAGSSYSWIQVCPRYKIDREGDRVLNSAEVLLKVAERSNEYIHRSDRPPLPGQDIEVNCSLEATSWKLNIFRSSVDSNDHNLLLSYELVYISDPETRCNLAIAPTALTTLEGDTLAMESSCSSDEDVEYFNSLDEFEDHIPVRNPGFHDFGNAILRTSDTHFSSDFLWFIENSVGLNGGPLKLKIDKVRLKHMNTSKYLKLDTIRVRNDEGELEERNIYTTTTDALDPGVAFSLVEASNPGKYLQNAKALQIGLNGLWMERGPLENGNYVVKPTEDKTIAVNLFINRFVEIRESDSVSDDSTEQASTEPLDAYVGMSIRGYLHKYLQMSQLPKTAAVNTIWPTANRGDMPFFQTMVTKVILFSQGFPISAENVLLGIDKGNSKLKIRRQSVLREQGTIEVILRVINKLIPITERADDIKNLPKRRAPVNENELAALEMGRIILSLCFDLLYYIILDNSENQIFVADFLPVLLAHLSSQPMAGKCVTEMLSKNWELQETKISKREIKIFVDKLRSSKMNSMYLQLLQSCCSCEGNGVDGNQGKVAEMLFEDTNDIIINLHADNNRSIKVEWTHSNLYVPAGNVPGSPIRADFLISKGLPKLSLAWTTNSIDFSPLGLFGKLSVGIEELFGLRSELQMDATDKSAGAISKKSKGKKNSLEQKRAVANYFIAEIFLGAEMCMDRNYISMHILDSMFPYEVLITLLKMDLSHEIKSAAVRLLMCLHIDRDPQAATKIPVLTRAWSDIEKNPTPHLPCVEAGRYYTFGLLQQLISEHVQAMAGIAWDDLSRHMLRMLRALVEFNFYGTNERMKDVIEPLITALDRRSISSESIVQRLSSKTIGSTLTPSPSTEELANQSATGNVEEEEEEPQSPSRAGTLTSMMKSMTSKFGDRQSVSEAKNDDSAVAIGTVKKYSIPTRYAKAPTYELETMVEMVDILAFAQKVIEDRNISLLMRYFFLWASGVDHRTPSQLFEQVMVDSRELTMDVANFDDVMIDTLMFEHNDLVQSALELLMAHHSKRLTLLMNLYDLQLLASPARERQFRIVDAMLKQLEQNAETQELWGELESEADRAINNQTIDILKELIDMCRVRQSKIDIEDENGDDNYRPDPAIQDLYRNLNCFVIAQKVLGLLDSVEEEEDGSISEAGENTQKLCRLCNELLYWFFLGNKKNQEMGYSDLEFFVETLDKNINSHRVIRAIFSNNEFLMRQVPHSYLNDLVNMIITNGKSHHYLTLLTAITHVGDKNIYENQLEICKTLTSPGPLQKVSCYFVPIDNPEYEEKRELMKPYLDTDNDVSLEELPPLLSYHLMFLEVLSGCTVGSKNMTTIEAKVQSVFNYEYILQSILDPDTITICKIRLSLFFFNSVIEVDLKIPGLEQSQEVWKLFESYRPVLTQAFEQVERVTKLGWDGPGVSKQKLQYIVVCIMIIGGFFEFYYQAAQFQPDDREGTTTTTTMTAASVVSKSKVNFSLNHVDDLIIFFFTKIKEIYDYDTPMFADSTKKMIYRVLQTLNARVSGENAIVTFIKPPHQLGVKENVMSAEGEEEDDESGYELAQDPEKDLLLKLKEFQNLLREDTEIQYKADNENVAFIRILESLPYIADPVIADVRYETLIKKLVFHIRKNIKMVNNQKRMDARVTATSTWIIRAFRTMIENRMGMSIYERDEEGGEEQDINAAPVVNALNTCSGTALCLDLIADGIDEKLQLEAIKLGVGLLFKEGGALKVQGIMNAHLSQTNSELFFRQVRLTLQKLQAWHEWNGYEKQLESEELLEPPKEILIVRFLQLMCEGHYLPNQDIMREQPHNRVSYNILDDLVNYLNFLSNTTPCQIDVEAAVRVSATILEVIQGPCVGNQTHFTLNTELVETLNRINRRRLENDCSASEEIELKKTSIDIFQGLLEGQGEKSVIYERVLSVIHLDIILSMSNGAILQGVDGEEKGGDDDESKEEKEILKTECVVLLQMLRNFKPSLAQELGISENLEDIVGSGTAMIEIVWRGEVQPRFFHIPQICGYLAQTSKDNLLENVDRSNPENKLVDLLSRAYELYLEVKHQEFLTKQNLSRVFSRENQNRATWITFYLAMAINVVLLLSYSAEHGGPTVNPHGAMIVSILNIIQAIVAGFVLLLFLVVRIPVKYQSLQRQGYSEYETWLYTAMEPMTLYYIWYLAFSILGQVVSYDFLPFLLLDIVVKNSTTRDVLNAVIYPRRQIMMGGIVILIIVQIYTFFLFLYFRNEILPQGREFCRTFWGCFRTTLGYGLRSGGGVGDVFEVSVKDRWALDITFYIAITVGMLNLIAGVIITTFGQLRENKAKRVADTVGVCFICGIDKQVFDRASDKPEGFKTHVKFDHNMWNYLFFIFLLWEQDKDDDDGLEQYVRRAIDANDIAWFPMNKAIRLRQAATKEESMLMSLTHRINQVETVVSGRLERFNTDINIALEQLNQVLKQDHADGRGAESRALKSRPVVPFGKNVEPPKSNIGPYPGEYVNVHTLSSSNLFLEILDLHEVRLPTGAGETNLQGIVEFQEKSYIIAVQRVHKSRVKFARNQRLKLVENVQCDDDRSCVFRLLFTDPISNESRSLAVVQIAIEELYLAEGSLLEIYLDPPDTRHRRKIVVMSSMEKVLNQK